MKNRKWLRLLAYVTSGLNQELLLQIEYLTAENRIAGTNLPAKLRLSDIERATLAEIEMKELASKALDNNELPQQSIDSRVAKHRSGDRDTRLSLLLSFRQSAHVQTRLGRRRSRRPAFRSGWWCRWWRRGR